MRFFIGIAFALSCIICTLVMITQQPTPKILDESLIDDRRPDLVQLDHELPEPGDVLDCGPPAEDPKVTITLPVVVQPERPSEKQLESEIRELVNLDDLAWSIPMHRIVDASELPTEREREMYKGCAGLSYCDGRISWVRERNGKPVSPDDDRAHRLAELKVAMEYTIAEMKRRHGLVIGNSIIKLEAFQEIERSYRALGEETVAEGYRWERGGFPASDETITLLEGEANR